MVHRRVLLAVIVIMFPLYHTQAFSGFDDFLKEIRKATGIDDAGLSQEKITKGLKESLEIGVSKAVEKVSSFNGYYQNEKIRIPLPDSVQKVTEVLKVAGFGSEVDAFELSMNRAAEKAAPRAKALFMESNKGMNFADARKILNGRDNEATLYFEEKTRGRLAQAFTPIIHTTMSEVGVTRQYQALDAKVRRIPFAGDMTFDLDQYVTDQALNGLFLMLAEEERKIREDPAARVTELLREVFGKQ